MQARSIILSVLVGTGVVLFQQPKCEASITSAISASAVILFPPAACDAGILDSLCSSITGFLNNEAAKTGAAVKKCGKSACAYTREKQSLIKSAQKEANSACGRGLAPDMAKISAGLDKNALKSLKQIYSRNSRMFDGTDPNLPAGDFSIKSKATPALTGKGGQVMSLKSADPNISKISPPTDFSLQKKPASLLASAKSAVMPKVALAASSPSSESCGHNEWHELNPDDIDPNVCNLNEWVEATTNKPYLSQGQNYLISEDDVQGWMKADKDGLAWSKGRLLNWPDDAAYKGLVVAYGHSLACDTKYLSKLQALRGKCDAEKKACEDAGKDWLTSYELSKGYVTNCVPKCADGQSHYKDGECPPTKEQCAQAQKLMLNVRWNEGTKSCGCVEGKTLPDGKCEQTCLGGRTWNDETNCLTQQEIEQLQAEEKKKEETECAPGKARNENKECESVIALSLGLLDKSPKGKVTADFIRQNNIPIKFKDLEKENEDAQYDAKHDIIYLSDKYENAKYPSPMEVAVLIAHEGFHARQDIQYKVESNPKMEAIAHVENNLVFEELFKAGVKPPPEGTGVMKDYKDFARLYRDVHGGRIDEYIKRKIKEEKQRREEILQKKTEKLPRPLRGPARWWLEFWDVADIRRYETIEEQKSKPSSWILFWRRWRLKHAAEVYDKQMKAYEQ